MLPDPLYCLKLPFEGDLLFSKQGNATGGSSVS